MQTFFNKFLVATLSGNNRKYGKIARILKSQNLIDRSTNYSQRYVFKIVEYDSDNSVKTNRFSVYWILENDSVRVKFLDEVDGLEPIVVNSNDYIDIYAPANQTASTIEIYVEYASNSSLLIPLITRNPTLNSDDIVGKVTPTYSNYSFKKQYDDLLNLKVKIGVTNSNSTIKFNINKRTLKTSYLLVNGNKLVNIFIGQNGTPIVCSDGYTGVLNDDEVTITATNSDFIENCTYMVFSDDKSLA